MHTRSEKGKSRQDGVVDPLLRRGPHVTRKPCLVTEVLSAGRDRTFDPAVGEKDRVVNVGLRFVRNDGRIPAKTGLLGRRRTGDSLTEQNLADQLSFLFFAKTKHDLGVLFGSPFQLSNEAMQTGGIRKTQMTRCGGQLHPIGVTAACHDFAGQSRAYSVHRLYSSVDRRLMCCGAPEWNVLLYVGSSHDCDYCIDTDTSDSTIPYIQWKPPKKRKGGTEAVI